MPSSVTNDLITSPSMEPWRCSHGDAETIGKAVQPLAYLQWSHGDVAMEMFQQKGGAGTVSALQWSHGDVAMEMRRQDSPLRYLPAPSMEPWRCSHGDRTSVITARPCSSYLQWSHGDVAMEIGSRPIPMTHYSRPSMEPWRCSHGDFLAWWGPLCSEINLQWSHGDVAMEISQASRSTAILASTFNGAMAM